MDAVAASIDLTRAVFLIGAVLALVYKRRMGVTPGGIIVPGTLAIALVSHASSFALTAASAVVCTLVYRSTFGRRALSRRWVALTCISLSVGVGLVVVALVQAHAPGAAEAAWLSLVTPGLVATNAHHYGLRRVLGATAVVTAATLAAAVALVLAVPDGLATYLTDRLAAYEPLSLVHPNVLLPASLALALAAHHFFGARVGGHLIVPFLLTITVVAPLQAFLLVAGVAASYGVVHLAQQRTFVVGLERFVLSLACSAIAVTAMDVLAMNVDIPGYRPAPLVLIVAVAVLTNDLSIHLARRTQARVIPAAITSAGDIASSEPGRATLIPLPTPAARRLEHV